MKVFKGKIEIRWYHIALMVVFGVLGLGLGFGAGFGVALQDDTNTQRILHIKNLYIQPNHGTFSAYYYDRVAYFQHQSQPCKVAMIGDSLTDIGDWGELLGRTDVVNRAISGDTSYGLLHRIEETLRCKPETVFLMIGINDLNSGAGAVWVAENVQKFIKIMKARGIQVVWQTNLYLAWVWDDVDKYKSPEPLNTKVDELNQLMRAFCEKEGIAVLDVAAPLIKDHKLNELYTHDGLHLDGKAYLIWGNLVKNKLDDLSQMQTNTKS